MIRKLLEDKEKMTLQLENYKQKLLDEENSKKNIEHSYENRIKTMMDENNEQVTTTKQQI